MVKEIKATDMPKSKKIPFEGIYWWSDAENVTSILEKEFKEILGSLRVTTIQIHGSDFNDGRESRTATIRVSENKIEVIKSYD
jgi:hypothetical protein